MNKKYKIAYTVPSSKISGSEKSLLLILENINKVLFDNTVICFGCGPLTKVLDKKNYKYIVINRKSRKSLLSFFKLLYFLKKNKINLLHVCSTRLDALCAKILNIPVIERLNMNRDTGKLFINRVSILDKFTANLCTDKIITVSKAIKKQTIQRGIKSNKIITIYNGINVNEYNQDIDKIKIKHKLKIDNDTIIITTIGRLEKQKGHKILLQSIPIIISNYQFTKFLIVGEGKLENYLIQLTKELNIIEHVLFTGYREDIINIYSISDIIVIPSLWEPLANVALEALAAQKPVIATHVDGMQEIIHHNRTGILVPPNDSNALSTAIIDLIKNPSMRTKLALNGHNYVKKTFTIKNMIKKTENLILASIKKP